MDNPIKQTLFKSIRDGDLDTVKDILNKNPELTNSQSSSGLGILSYSLVAAKEEIFDYLINNLTEKEIFIGTLNPVSLAIEYNENEYLEKLLRSQKVTIDVNSTYLIDAYQNKKSSPKTIKQLNDFGMTLDKPFMVDNGISTFNRIFKNPKDQDIVLTLPKEELDKLITPETFYSLASNKDLTPEILKEFFTRHAVLSESQKDTLFASAFNNKNYVLVGEMTSLTGFYPSSEDVYKMINLVINEDLAEKSNLNKIKEFVMENSPRIDKYGDYFGEPLLSSCIRKEKIDLFNHFLNEGAEINEPSRGMLETPLMTAVKFQKNDIIESLLDAGASTTVVNRNGDTALHIAISKGNYSAFDTILEKGSAYIGTKNNEGYTPLALAIHLQDKVMISKLLWKGADLMRSPITASFDNGYYSLDLKNGEMNSQIENKTLNDFLSIANYGLNLNHRNEKGQTLAHYFIETGNTNNFKAFLSLSINPNLQDNNGNTILMTAAKSSDDVFLISHMFNPSQTDYTIKNNEGKDIYDILLEKKDIKRICEVLSTQLKYRNKESEVLPILKKLLPVLAYTTDLKPFESTITEYSKKTEFLHSNGTPIMCLTLLTKKLDNFELLLKIKPQQLFKLNNEGKSTADVINNLKNGSKDYFNEINEIVNKYLPKNILNTIVEEPINLAIGEKLTESKTDKNPSRKTTLK